MRTSPILGAILLALAAPAPAQPEPAIAAAPPVRPERPAVPVVTAADCEDPARRAALLADPEASAAAVMAYGQALDAYSQAMNQWRAEQLTRSGRWSAEDRRRFGLRILDHPQVQSEFAANARLVGEMFEHALLIGDTRKPALERCRGLLATQDYFERITRSVEAQWQLIDRMFAEEAARIGVTLD